MPPEISRRCASCGASIRERAMFCPECGQPQSQASAVSESQPVAGGSALKAAENAAAGQSTEVTVQTSAVSADVRSSVQVESKVRDPDGSAKKLPPPPVSKPGKYEKARDSLHRASTATRDALADNVKRVEKIRNVSSAMFEEATYDPSLRFVLVALALFVIFLGLLLLSKVMG